MAEKQPQVSSTVSGTSELAMTSAPLGIHWHFAHSWASLLTLRAEANNAGTQPAVTAASQRRAAAAAASQGCFSCQIPVGISQGRHFPKPARAEDFLWCAERETFQEQWVPGSCAAFHSVWISKLFNFSWFGAKGKNFIILGSLFSDGQGCFFHFFTDSVTVSALKAGVKHNYDHMPCVRSIFQSAVPGEMRRASFYPTWICNVSFFPSPSTNTLCKEEPFHTFTKWVSLWPCLGCMHKLWDRRGQTQPTTQRSTTQRLQEMSWAEWIGRRSVREYQSFSKLSSHVRKPQKRMKLG